MSRIEAENLTKRFGKLTAVDHISFEVDQGEIFGLLGPNGSGKTTTIRMLASLLTPDEGYARVSGHDTVKDSIKVRESIGILTENPSIYERLTAYENMHFYAEAYGIEDKEERSRRISARAPMVKGIE
jgi:ABC-2 type transport system ATP-binding protein